MSLGGVANGQTPEKEALSRSQVNDGGSSEWTRSRLGGDAEGRHGNRGYQTRDLSVSPGPLWVYPGSGGPEGGMTLIFGCPGPDRDWRGTRGSRGRGPRQTGGPET